MYGQPVQEEKDSRLLQGVKNIIYVTVGKDEDYHLNQMFHLEGANRM